MNQAKFNESDLLSVYVGTYGQYNNGSLIGFWCNPLEDFSGLDEFMEHCGEWHKARGDFFVVDDYLFKSI